MKGDFLTDMKSGKAAESAVSQALEAKGHMVIDVSDHRQYQQLDIDFLLERNGKAASLEVKNEIRSEETGRVFLETRYKDSKGWFAVCGADYVAFCQMEQGIAHLVALDELRASVCANSYPACWNQWKTACGILFPIEELQKLQSYYKLQLGGKDNG